MHEGIVSRCGKQGQAELHRKYLERSLAGCSERRQGQMPASPQSTAVDANSPPGAGPAGLSSLAVRAVPHCAPAPTRDQR